MSVKKLNTAQAIESLQQKEEVNHPEHYNNLPAKCLDCGRPIECIDVIEHLPANLANAVKYVWRYKDKGTPIKDLRKALWYINREIEKMEREAK